MKRIQIDIICEDDVYDEFMAAVEANGDTKEEYVKKAVNAYHSCYEIF